MWIQQELERNAGKKTKSNSWQIFIANSKEPYFMILKKCKKSRVDDEWNATETHTFAHK